MAMRWKDIKGYEGIYQISDMGLVRSLPRKRRLEIKILKPHESSWGYQSVGLTRPSGRSKTCRVHTLVAETFIGPRTPKRVINHINGDKRDNRVSNLEYVTALENYKHGIKNGLFKRKNPGTLRGRESQVEALFKAGISAFTIAQVMKVHYRTVLRYRHRNNYY